MMSMTFAIQGLLARVLIFLIGALLIPCTHHAQSISLPGTIAIQNSQYETGKRQFISDASVRAPLSKPTTSDNTGQFKLEFAGVSSGTPVRLTVSKPGYEVVNAREVQSVILGRIPAVDVLMADAQKLADAQLKYYQIATEGITQGYQRKLAALNRENEALADRLAQFNAEHKREVSSLMQAINVLSSERDKAMGNAGELAERFATTDLDNASDLFRRAFELFKDGQLDSVLVLLNKERLDAELASAREDKEQANERIRQVYKNLELKVSVLQSTMDHAGALVVLDEMEAMLKTDADAFPITAEPELAMLRGNVLITMARFKEAIAVFSRGRELVRQRYGQADRTQVPFVIKLAGCAQVTDSFPRGTELLNEALALMAGHEEEEPLLIADIEFHLSRSFDHERDLDAAMSHAEKSLALRKAHLKPDHPLVIRSMQAIALIMRSQGRYEETLEYQLQMLELAGPDGVNYPSGYGSLLHNIGQEYKSKGDLVEAEGFLRRALEQEIKALGPQHPSVFSVFISTASLMDDLGREQEAIHLLDSALVLNKGTVPEEHNIMGYYHFVRASVLSDIGDQQAAMEEVKRAVDIRLKVYGPKHPYVVATQEVMATIQARQGDLEGALNTTSGMLQVFEETMGPDDPNTRAVAMNKAGYLVDLARDTAALSLYRLHFPPALLAFGEKDPYILAARLKLATALYRTGDLDSAQVVLEKLNAITPHQQAEWYLSKIAMDQDRKSDSLEHLIKSARLCDEDTDPEQKKVLMHALKELAVRLDRKDVLQEFNLTD
ncbi:MAG: tetratricopeptide repeat protein [Flavobacteriales bacterium]|nr:tetratricopeptide repeat protein [Flavobacteriales bacterium]